VSIRSSLIGGTGVVLPSFLPRFEQRRYEMMFAHRIDTERHRVVQLCLAL
jgi:hypothetical protein